MPAEVKKTVRRKLRTGPIQMLFPCADVLIDNIGLVAGMTELSHRVIFRVVPPEEVMLVFPGVDQEKLVILLQRACLNVRLEAKRALVPVIPGINDGLHDLVVQSGLEDRLLVGDVQQHELPVVVRRSVFQKAAFRILLAQGIERCLRSERDVNFVYMCITPLYTSSITRVSRMLCKKGNFARMNWQF